LFRIADPCSIQPHAHNFPSQHARLTNLIRGDDEQEWYGDKEVAEAEVLFAVEKLRGYVSLFAESKAALDAALRLLSVDKQGTHKTVAFLSIADRFVGHVSQTLTELDLDIHPPDELGRIKTQSIFAS